MGSYALNALSAPDQYTPLSTIEGVAIKRVVIDVANQAIYWQLKYGQGSSSGVWDGTEFFMSPGSRSIFDTNIVGVRVRAAIPLAQLPTGANRAVVTVRAVS